MDFSPQLLNFWLIFLSRSIMSTKIKIVFTLAWVWNCPFTAFLNPWDFNPPYSLTLQYWLRVLVMKNLKINLRACQIGMIKEYFIKSGTIRFTQKIKSNIAIHETIFPCIREQNICTCSLKSVDKSFCTMYCITKQ